MSKIIVQQSNILKTHPHKASCNKCECKFRYQDEDIENKTGGIIKVEERGQTYCTEEILQVYTLCPVCKNIITIAKKGDD